VTTLDAPGYWMNETSGVLRPAVEAYLKGELITHGQIAAIRAYLRQWMAGPWQGEDIEALRAGIDGLTTRTAIHAWLTRALEAGIDPL
jgi:mono/diheme cytochrome c family protein